MWGWPRPATGSEASTFPPPWPACWPPWALRWSWAVFWPAPEPTTTSSASKDAATKLSLGGLIGGLVTLFVAFLVGGWVAGRVARYNGGLNGLLTALWFVLLAGAMAALGAWAGDKYNVFSNVNLPQWFSRNARGASAILSGLVALAAMLGAGWLGGRLGDRYHRRVDSPIARAVPGHERLHPLMFDDLADSDAPRLGHRGVGDQLLLVAHHRGLLLPGRARRSGLGHGARSTRRGSATAPGRVRAITESARQW